MHEGAAFFFEFLQRPPIGPKSGCTIPMLGLRKRAAAMADDPRECLAFASCCTRSAAETTDPELTEWLLEVAAKWTHLASELDNFHQIIATWGMSAA
jgi:hypothetical protein